MAGLKLGDLPALPIPMYEHATLLWWLERPFYKPGYKFTAVEVDGRLSVCVSARLPNARDYAAARLRGADRCLPVAGVRESEVYRYVGAEPFLRAIADNDRRTFKYLLRDLVIGFEFHEIDEWLGFDDELLADPHA